LYILASCFVVNGVNDDHDDGFIEVRDPQAFFISADNCDNRNLLFIFDNNNCDNSNRNDDVAFEVVLDLLLAAAAIATAVDDDDDDDDKNDDDALTVVRDSTS